MAKLTLAGAAVLLATAAGLLCWLSRMSGSAVAPGVIRGTEALDPRLAMIRTLQAMGPAPSLGDQAKVFGRFVGTWNVNYGEIAEDGKVTHFKGELVVGWVMDGYAIQDLFIAYPTAKHKERTMGTTIRFFDRKSGKWRVVYVEPPTNTVVELTGGQVGDRIILYGHDRDGALMRWSFNDIKENSFVWRDEKSRDGGRTWRLTEQHYMTRRLAAR